MFITVWETLAGVSIGFIFSLIVQYYNNIVQERKNYTELIIQFSQEARFSINQDWKSIKDVYDSIHQLELNIIHVDIYIQIFKKKLKSSKQIPLYEKELKANLSIMKDFFKDESRILNDFSGLWEETKTTYKNLVKEIKKCTLARIK